MLAVKHIDFLMNLCLYESMIVLLGDDTYRKRGRQMAETTLTRTEAVNELRRLEEHTISTMKIDELKSHLKRVVPFGFMPLRVDQIDSLSLDRARARLVEARRTAMSIRVN